MPKILPKVLGAVTNIRKLELACRQKLPDLQEHKRLLKGKLKAGYATEKQYKIVISAIRNLEYEQKNLTSQIRTGVFDGITELASIMKYGDETQVFDYVFRHTRR